jgi:hypothetical protein
MLFFLNLSVARDQALIERHKALSGGNLSDPVGVFPGKLLAGSEEVHSLFRQDVPCYNQK